MSDTLEVIKTRYACRDFDGKPVPDGVLHEIAYAGLCAPSAMNLQPWRICVVKDKAVIAALDARGMAKLALSNPGAHQRMMDRGGSLFYNASAMIVVAKQSAGQFAPELDCGIVTANLILAARALAVDSVVCGFAGILFDGEGAAEAKKQFGFPEGFEFAVSVLLGQASGAPNAPHAPDLEKLIEVG
ncbi:MAG: nitroreductase family protein [Propionibacteriaceae bacterium]|jgi:nitroreductase|nr:nitroreductase family protein [Propionibacteriaceae bacterium]